MKDTLQYKDYIGSVHFSEEDGVFFGKIEGITDLVTFEGTTVEEIKIAFHEAIEDYTSICKETGKIAQKSCKGNFRVKIPPELHKKAVQQSVIQRVTLNDIIQQALERELLIPH
jgi:predicted HicB family RNase H-like nuclease